MPSRVRCFLLLPTDDVEVSLRRFAFGREGAPPCGRKEQRYPGADAVTYESHDATVVIGQETGTLEASLDGDRARRSIPADDPRWPRACACGYAFQDSDNYQENRTRLYDRSDGGPRTTISNATAGALYNSPSFRTSEDFTRNGPDMCLVCKTPAGEWIVDGPSSNGSGWTRTGTPPDIIVQPSISIGNPPRMHGWLGGPGHNEPGWLVIDSP